MTWNEHSPAERATRRDLEEVGAHVCRRELRRRVEAHGDEFAEARRVVVEHGARAAKASSTGFASLRRRCSSARPACSGRHAWLRNCSKNLTLSVLPAPPLAAHDHALAPARLAQRAHRRRRARTRAVGCCWIGRLHVFGELRRAVQRHRAEWVERHEQRTAARVDAAVRRLRAAAEGIGDGSGRDRRQIYEVLHRGSRTSTSQLAIHSTTHPFGLSSARPHWGHLPLTYSKHGFLPHNAAAGVAILSRGRGALVRAQVSRAAHPPLRL